MNTFIRYQGFSNFPENSPIPQRCFISPNFQFLGKFPQGWQRCWQARWAKGYPVNWNLVPARFLQRHFCSGVGFGVGQTNSGDRNTIAAVSHMFFLNQRWCIIIPTSTGSPYNSLLWRWNYQRGRQSRQRWIIASLGVTTPVYNIR